MWSNILTTGYPRERASHEVLFSSPSCLQYDALWMPGGAELQASHDPRPGGVPRATHSGTELFRRSGVVECLLRSILECAHQRGAKEQLRPENGDRQSQRGRGVSWRGPVCLLSHSEPGVRGPTRSCCLQI